jgi:hypothetical protein
MSWVQRLITSLVSKQAASRMERESRLWIQTCECGFEQSVWESGGIRWGAKGSPRRMLKCSACNRKRWHTLSRRETL